MIEKSPQNKAMKPQENKMPKKVGDQRNKICEDAGHRFSPVIMKFLEEPTKYAGRIPNVALCVRCGQKINLAEMV